MTIPQILMIVYLALLVADAFLEKEHSVRKSLINVVLLFLLLVAGKYWT